MIGAFGEAPLAEQAEDSVSSDAARDGLHTFKGLTGIIDFERRAERGFLHESIRHVVMFA